MSYIGDIALGQTIDIKFTTVNGSGVPTTLAGSPVISAYPGNSTTELTAGITLTVDFDARTGMHNVRVVASGGNGYAIATNYSLVITTGTVGGNSVVGYVVGEFSIEARDTLFIRDLSTVSGEAARSFLNAIRLLRNKWAISTGTMTVYKEDDTTSAWTSALTS